MAAMTMVIIVKKQLNSSPHSPHRHAGIDKRGPRETPNFPNKTWAHVQTALNLTKT